MEGTLNDISLNLEFNFESQTAIEPNFDASAFSYFDVSCACIVSFSCTCCSVFFEVVGCPSRSMALGGELPQGFSRERCRVVGGRNYGLAGFRR